MAHLALGEHRVRRLVHRLAVGTGDQPAAGQPVHAFDVGARVDRDDAGRRLAPRAASMERMRACACGERRKYACAVPGGIDVVGVVARAGQEAEVLLAADGWPMTLVSLAPMVSLPGAWRPRLLHRLHDVVVAGAAAQVAVEALRASSSRRDSGAAATQVEGAHHHARGAEAALQRRDTRGTPPASDAARRCAPRPRSSSPWRRRPAAARIVHDFTARPSRCTVQAPHWPVSQPTWVPVSASSFAQELDQQRARVDCRGDRLAVDGQGKRD